MKRLASAIAQTRPWTQVDSVGDERGEIGEEGRSGRRAELFTDPLSVAVMIGPSQAAVNARLKQSKYVAERR